MATSTTFPPKVPTIKSSSPMLLCSIPKFLLIPSPSPRSSKHVHPLTSFPLAFSSTNASFFLASPLILT
ncbi:hypothetical protein AHAS_Ahas17G0127500 [Arachis hypogaea]